MYKNFTETDLLLVAEHLDFSLNGRKILSDVSLSLPLGQVTVLLGPNGAGKSTLMRLLSGYLAPERGTCRFHQRSISEFEHRDLAQLRAVMRQHSQINFPFSAEEVIRMGGYHRRHQSLESSIEQVISLTDCQALRRKPYRTLSGGEQQRTQLARALLQLWSEDMQGKLLFLDEPTSASDLYHQQHCLRLMAKLCRERGLTVCCILHDLNLASLYGDQLLLLAETRLQVRGSAYEVLTEENITHWYKAEVDILPHHLQNVPQVQMRV